MIRMILFAALTFTVLPARADLFGGDLPLLAQIVANTMNTLNQLHQQTQLMRDEMNGIKNRLFRMQSISQMVQPSQWEEWRDPAEAIKRLHAIYYMLPKEYRSAKSDIIDEEFSRAMNLIAKIKPESKAAFQSGKDLEDRATTASPGVAAKMTASGVGTLISLEAQTQVIQSHITSLLAQMLAQGNEQESRAVVARGASFTGISENLGQDNGWFSEHVLYLRRAR